MANRLKQGSAILATAVALIGGFEGLRLTSYQDVVGVWTVCYGETRGIHRGAHFTKAECDAQFGKRLVEFETGIRSCLINPDSIPTKPYVSFLSLAYNIGTSAFCRSSVARAANQGDYVTACKKMANFTRAGGSVVRGLVSRRNTEEKYCLSGIPNAQ
jgi:lysozyme